MGLSAQARAVVTHRVGWLALTFVTDQDEATAPCLQAACQELDRMVSDIMGDRGQGEYRFRPEPIQFVTITTIVDRHIRGSHFGFWPGVHAAGHEAPSSLSVSQRGSGPMLPGIERMGADARRKRVSYLRPFSQPLGCSDLHSIQGPAQACAGLSFLLSPNLPPMGDHRVTPKVKLRNRQAR